MNIEAVAEQRLEAKAMPSTVWDSPIDLATLIDKPPEPIPEFIRERIQLARGILLTGIGGSSKTRLIYQLAIGAIVGRVAWNWTVAKKGRAVLVLTEDVATDVHRTIYYTCKGLGLSKDEREQVSRNIHAYALAGQDVLLLASDDRVLSKSPAFYSLAERIKAIGNVVFVGLDPALSLTAGDEMDQSHQRALGKMADDLAVQTGATVCLVSHATKGSQSADELSSHNSRGGGAITDAVRAEYAMRTMTASEAAKAGIGNIAERKRHVQLVATKGNHIPPEAFAPVWLRRGDHGVLMAADVDLSNADRGPGPRALKALEVLQELQKIHTPKLAEWRDECVARGIVTDASDEASRKAMNRIKASLQQEGLIEPGIGRGIWIATQEQET